MHKSQIQMKCKENYYCRHQRFNVIYVEYLIVVNIL